jgi:diguanylate cyclase (GGDEF)-like protein
MTVAEMESKEQIDAEFFQRTLDCLRSHMAILTPNGVIVAANATWYQFAAANGLAQEFCGPGANYLRSCDQAVGECSEEAPAVAQGIRDVIAKRREYFQLEYPCHSPTERRWFNVRATRFEIGDSLRIVVTHDNITARKLAEQELLETHRILKWQAQTDGLTGVGNRRSFDRELKQEWNRHTRSVSSLSVALLDVDCFKQFNDQYGHLAGDDCLKRVAEAIKSQMRRSGDSASRYGGEEFAVILPDTDTHGAKAILQSIVSGVRELNIPHPSSTVARGVVTVSIGCATTVPTKADSPAYLLEHADQALYQAKEGGRDRLILVEPTKR